MNAFGSGAMPIGKRGYRDSRTVTASAQPAEIHDSASLRRTGAVELIDAQVSRRPHEVAVRCTNSHLTYAGLDARARALAARLATYGVGKGELVGIAVPRSTDLLVAIVGVMKSGAAFVPIDLGHPEARIRYILHDSGAKVVVATADAASRLPGACHVVVLDEGTVGEGVHHAAGTDPLAPPSAADAAYLMYTSGSSGQPKGIVVSHGALATFIEAIRQQGWCAPRERMIAVTTVTFDISILELVVPLCFGGEVVVAADDEVRDAIKVRSLILEYQPATVQATPSLWAALVNHDAPGLTHCRALVGGEPLRRDIAAALLRSAAEVINLYGPTEATIWASAHRVTAADCESQSAEYVSIGSALPGYVLYVLDEHLQPTPTGDVGELFIAGSGLADAYWGRPGQTAEHFIANPDGRAGERMYRTGDMVRARPDGTLLFVGRSDHQVKVRGFRIELGEIETVLRAHPAVRDAVATVRGSHQQLLAYVVRDGTEKDSGRSSHIERWQQVWDSTYRQPAVGSDDFNTVGWTSSFTGLPLPLEEMREWSQNIIRLLEPFAPRSVLDVGCGTGLLLPGFAAMCESYIGLDVSAEALRQIQRQMAARKDWAHVQLRQGAADDLAFLDDDSVDLVVLNSVVQYFPNVSYLMAVLKEAVRVTRRGGHVFLGDIRSLPLLEAFHTALQLHKAEDDVSVHSLRERIRRSQAAEKELLIDPMLFDELARTWPKISAAATTLKRGVARNELTMFRYDVVLDVGSSKRAVVEPVAWVTWDAEGRWQGEVDAAWRMQPLGSVGLRAIKDARVAGCVEAVKLLSMDDSHPYTARWIRESISCVAGQDIDRLIEWSRDRGVEMLCRRFHPDGSYEALFNVTWTSEAQPTTAQRSHYGGFVNAPAKNAVGAFSRLVYEHARLTLPPYMLPDALIELDALPLTPNGKVDRNALPDAAASSAMYRAPRTREEEIMCQLFANVLSVARVGIDDNFFEMGGHSLMAMQLADSVRTDLQATVSIETLFEAPTVAQLCALLRLGASHTTRVNTARVVTLRAGAQAAPLVCLPPVYGLGFAYAGLLRELNPERPIYCLQASGIAQGEPLLESLQEVAADYIRLIKSIQPEGPYHLFGWSVGGLLAHEVACTLQRSGDSVALLAIIDAYPPNEARTRERNYARVGRLIREHVEDGLQEKDTERVERVMRVVSNYSKFLSTFVPQVFHGDVLLVCAANNTGWTHLWAPHVAGDLNVRVLACGHMQMMTVEYMGQVAALVEQQIRSHCLNGAV
jgi:pristinamycin I synthase 3 and 4